MCAVFSPFSFSRTKYQIGLCWRY